MSIEWQTVAEDFARDGALRDIYILQTIASDWQHALDTVRSTATDIQYRCGEKLLPLPSSFGSQDEFGRLLSFRIGRIGLACHFFHDAEIEFDFWPHDLTSQADLDDLLTFLQHLGDSVGKPVIVCPENCPESAFLRYEPESHSTAFIPHATPGNA